MLRCAEATAGVYDGWDLCDRHAALQQVIPLQAGDRAWPLVQAAAATAHIPDRPVFIAWGLRDFVFTTCTSSAASQGALPRAIVRATLTMPAITCWRTSTGVLGAGDPAASSTRIRWLRAPEWISGRARLPACAETAADFALDAPCEKLRSCASSASSLMLRRASRFLLQPRLRRSIREARCLAKAWRNPGRQLRWLEQAGGEGRWTWRARPATVLSTPCSRPA